jgi:hypothetical protein
MATHSSWPERLKWAEEQGLKNLQEKFTTGDNINKEAQTTLTYVLAAMGASFAYVVQALEKPLTPLVFGAAVLCIYFTVLGVVLVWKTFFLGEFPSPYQEPKNLTVDPSVPLDDVREGELANIGDRIDEAKRWIMRKSRVINVVRALLVASPLVFLLALCLYGKWA